MIEEKDINKIKSTVEDFFIRLGSPISKINIGSSVENNDNEKESVDLEIIIEEPQIFIGSQGQTLFEIQRLLRTILNKKIQKIFYLNFDINEYKRKKIEYLKDLAKDIADEVVLYKKEKILSPMSSYERRIIHSELSSKPGIITESVGDGQERHIIIKPK